MQVDVRVDLDRLARRYRRLGGTVIQRVEARALNRTVAQARTQAVRSIARAAGMPVRKVRRDVVMERASRNRIRAALVATGRPANLINFSARQTRKGVSARAWGVRKVYRGTFIGNSGRTVFVRTTRRRLPIKAVWGPSVPQTWVNEQLPRILERFVRERLARVFHRELEFELSRGRRR